MMFVRTRETLPDGSEEVDDDCDGVDDDDFPSQSTNCGVGACASTGRSCRLLNHALGDEFLDARGVETGV